MTTRRSGFRLPGQSHAIGRSLRFNKFGLLVTGNDDSTASAREVLDAGNLGNNAAAIVSALNDYIADGGAIEHPSNSDLHATRVFAQRSTTGKTTLTVVYGPKHFKLYDISIAKVPYRDRIIVPEVLASDDHIGVQQFTTSVQRQRSVYTIRYTVNQVLNLGVPPWEPNERLLDSVNNNEFTFYGTNISPQRWTCRYDGAQHSSEQWGNQVHADVTYTFTWIEDGRGFWKDIQFVGVFEDGTPPPVRIPTYVARRFPALPGWPGFDPEDTLPQGPIPLSRQDIVPLATMQSTNNP